MQKALENAANDPNVLPPFRALEGLIARLDKNVPHWTKLVPESVSAAQSALIANAPSYSSSSSSFSSSSSPSSSADSGQQPPIAPLLSRETPVERRAREEVEAAMARLSAEPALQFVALLPASSAVRMLQNHVVVEAGYNATATGKGDLRHLLVTRRPPREPRSGGTTSSSSSDLLDPNTEDAGELQQQALLEAVNPLEEEQATSGTSTTTTTPQAPPERKQQPEEEAEEAEEGSATNQEQDTILAEVESAHTAAIGSESSKIEGLVECYRVLLERNRVLGKPESKVEREATAMYHAKPLSFQKLNRISKKQHQRAREAVDLEVANGRVVEKKKKNTSSLL